MTFISTAGVFDGTKESGPYTEFDAPNPINTYGATKFEAEKLVAGILEKYYIIRAGWMVGGGADKDHKFVARILSQVREGRTTIHAVGDKFGTPTYTYDFAQNMLELVETPFYGRYHMACLGEGSRYQDVALEIVDFYGRRDVSVVPVTSDAFVDDYPAPRPRSEMMRNRMLELRGMNRMRRGAKDEYLELRLPPLAGLAMAGAATSRPPARTRSRLGTARSQRWRPLARDPERYGFSQRAVFHEGLDVVRSARRGRRGRGRGAASRYLRERPPTRGNHRDATSIAQEVGSQSLRWGREEKDEARLDTIVRVPPR